MTGVTTEGDDAIVTVDLASYPIEAIYSAASAYLDSYYLMLDAGREGIIVRITPKNGEGTPLETGRLFLNDLILHAEHWKRAANTKEIRETILRQAIINSGPCATHDELSMETDETDDPEGIRTLWEDNYGNDTHKAKQQDL